MVAGQAHERDEEDERHHHRRHPGLTVSSEGPQVVSTLMHDQREGTR
jgi:hypothetical protein